MKIEIEYFYILILGFILSILQSKLTQIIIKYKESMKYKNEFYSYKYFLPDTAILKKNHRKIQKEIYNINDKLWDNFPNYKAKKNKYWKLNLLIYNGKEIDKNIKLFNETYIIIKKIKNIVNVYYSKISPNTNIIICNSKKNYFISKNIIKLYYLVECGNNFEIIVNKKSKKLKNNDIIIFDYYDNIILKNKSKKDTIIMVCDIKKPLDIKRNNFKLSNKPYFKKYVDTIE